MDPSWSVDAHRLGRRGLREVSRLSTRAFCDSPFFEFIWPHERTRRHALYYTHYAAFAHPGPGAHLRTVRDAAGVITATALWLPTGAYPPPVGVQLQQLPRGLRANYRSPRSIRIGYAYLKAAAASHPKEPHWYLHVLMTEPVHQHHGAGAALMADGLARVDAEGVGASLETQDEANIAFYARFGFELRATMHPVEGGPPLYSLWREPRA